MKTFNFFRSGDRQANDSPNRFLIGHHGEEARPDVVIVTHVLVFLLAPDQLGVGEALHLSPHQVEGERRDLEPKQQRHQ